MGLKSRMLLASVCAASLMLVGPVIAGETVQTRIGPLSFTHSFTTGYPTDETVSRLYDEMDFQRAVQSYYWAIPLVSMAQWRESHVGQLGALNGQAIFFETYADKIGGLTFNATTPYLLNFVDLADGAWVMDLPGPEGSVRGATHDMWQISFTQLTKPGRYVFYGPGQDAPKIEGAQAFQSPTNGLLLVTRLMPEDPAERQALLDKIAVYPLAEIDTRNLVVTFVPKVGHGWGQRLSDCSTGSSSTTRYSASRFSNATGFSWQ